MPKESSRPSGRIVSDDRGNRTWEWQVETGVFSSEADTARVRALVPESLAVDDTKRLKKPDFNPYNSGGVPRQPLSRRTLDDMRKLDAEIKRRKSTKP